jgi:hypothetical protein
MAIITKNPKKRLEYDIFERVWKIHKFIGHDEIDGISRLSGLSRPNSPPVALLPGWN